MSGPPSRRSTRTTSPASSPPAPAPLRGRRTVAGLPAGLVLLTALAAFGVLLLYLLAVRTSWGQELDERTLLGADILSDVRAAQADRFLRIVSVGTLALAMGLVGAVAFLRGRPRLALIAAASIAAAVGVTEVLKLVVLERPDFVPTVLDDGDNSYPSGHTTVGTSVVVAAMLVVPARLRLVTAFGAGAIAAAFGIAVVAAGWHRPADPAGSYLVCLSVGAAAAIAIRAWPDRAGPDRSRAPIPGPVSIGPTELALLALAGALVAIFGLAALSARGVPFFSVGAAFLIACGVLLVVAFASTLSLAWAMSAAEADDRAQ